MKDFLALSAKNRLLLVLSYFLVAFGQPAWIPFCGPISAAFGYALFWAYLDASKGKSNHFRISFFWFFFVQIVQLSWFTSIKYQGFYIVVVYFLLCSFLGLQFGVLTRFLFSRGCNSVTSALSLAAAGTLLEWSRLFVFCGFSFNFSGIALTCYLPTLQFASVFGILGLSFLFLLANALAFSCYKNRFKLKSVLAWCAAFGFPYLFGIFSLQIQARTEAESSSMRVLLVQTALSPSQKFPLRRFAHEFVSPYEQWRQIFSFVMPHKESGIDLLVLPESVVPFGMDLPVYSLLNVEFVSRSLGINLTSYFPSLEAPFAEQKEGKWFVSNAFWAQTLANYAESEVIAGFDCRDAELKENYNAAFFFKPRANQFERYEKRVLLPLAEELPAEFLKIFTKAYGIEEFFTPGKESKIFSSMWKAGVSICIEETIPEIMREARNKGAKLFVNLSNDAWYPRSKLAVQHFFHGRVRAVENGIPLVRACNTGVTGVVDLNGRLLCGIQPESLSSEAEQGCVYKKIDLQSASTMYSLWGDAGIITLALLILAWSFRPREEGLVL